MKAFKTIKGAFNYIKRNANTGKEKTINEVLHFGMSIYTYSDVLTFSGVKDLTKTNECFYHFKDDNEIIKFLSWIQKSDGYLCIE